MYKRQAIDRADETARPLPPLVAEAVAALRPNYMALYGVEELSEQLGVTKSHLVRVFKQEIGEMCIRDRCRALSPTAQDGGSR